jgi:hypothetical protein
MLLMNSLQPPNLADVIFWGVEGVYDPQSAQAMMNRHNIGVF